MRHLLIILSFFLSLFLSAQTIYEGTHKSFGHEDNYSIALPSEPGWADDYFIGGTHWQSTPPSPYLSRLKRVDILGDILWDNDLSLYDGAGILMNNRTLHVEDSPFWLGGSTIGVGYLENATNNGLIYGVKDNGDLAQPQEFVPVAGGDTEHEEFVHVDEVTDENGNLLGWIVVGNSKSAVPGANNRAVLLSYISSTGAVLWTIHLGSGNDGAPIDWDYGSNVLHIPGHGFFVSGSGNIYDPNSMSYKQGAIATLIGYGGAIIWHHIYTHSIDSYDTVSASAFYDETEGTIFQIANGQGDPTFLENGFSLNAFKVTSGQMLPEYRRNFYLDNKALKGMTVQPAQTGDNIVVSGFVDMPKPPIGTSAWPNGLMGQDHPPFLMEFSRLMDNSGSTVMWNKVYPVESAGYGWTTADAYEIYSNMNQPLFYHPEMLTQNLDSSTYTLVGLHEEGSGAFDLEFIHTDIHGDALCDEETLDIIEVVKQIDVGGPPMVDFKEYQLINVPWDLVANQPDNIPCDICDPNLSMTVVADCDEVTISLVYAGDIASVCLHINWGDGTTDDVPASDVITHVFATGFTGGDVCVTSFCCGFSGAGPMDFNCLPIPLPDDCDCGHCHPFVTVCQNDFSSVAEQLTDPSAAPLSDFSIGTLLLFPPCEGGCADAPYSIHVTLGSIITSFFGSCLDHHSIEYVVDGIVVATQGCGLYAPIDLPVASAGDHVLEVVLTDCTNPACVDVRTREFSVGDCVPPETPRFKLVDSPLLESWCGSAFNCSRYLSPLTEPAECMDIKWIVDGVEIDGGFYSLGKCFSWGCHTVQMKMYCIDDESVYSLSEPQTFCCGFLEIGPMVLLDTSPEWLPYYYPLSTTIDANCNLVIEIESPMLEEGVSNTFSIFEGIWDSTPEFDGLEFQITLSQNNEVVGHIWSTSGTTGIWTDGPIHGVWTNGNATSVWTNGNATSLLSINLEDPGNTWSDLGIIANTSVQVCIEITGPDWLVGNLAAPLQHCKDVYPCATQLESDCPSDLNGDGLVATQDLLLFLTDFGNACE
jgi:hypothetical protein